ncbi:hypothetical protein QEM27_003190 [Pseudomonas putida]|nr:hypothetical protein [Pseudomonas putida]EKT8868122.1 hypothetical protein [Pseudomonas putida]
MDKRNLLVIDGAIVVAGTWVAGSRSASEAGLLDKERDLLERYGENIKQPATGLL